MPDNGVLFVLTVPSKYELIIPAPDDDISIEKKNNGESLINNDEDENSAIVSPPNIEDDDNNDNDDDSDNNNDDDNNNSGSVEIDVVEFLRALLPTRCHVHNAVFTFDKEGCVYTIVFPMASEYESVLEFLTGFGVGVFFGTISIVPLSVVKIYDPNSVKGTVFKEKDDGPINVSDTMKSRLLLEKVIAQVKANASMSFDFLILTITASLLAGVGLVTNNVVVIVASMLVSPLMGPVLGFTFGAVMRDVSMVRNGFLTLMMALSLLVIIGFFVGVGFAAWATDFEWPTDEMKNRGLVSGLFIGLTIAIPSGFGVALSVLGDNTASLVGVAISASLLPPAVNTGIFFAYALIGSDFDVRDRSAPVDRVYMVELGCISFALTILNIACIFFSAIAMFWVKEVVPFKGKSNFFKVFTASLNYHKRINNEEAAALEIELQQVWKQDSQIDLGSQRVLRGKDALVLKSDLDRELAKADERTMHEQLPQRIREDENLMQQLRTLHSLVTMKNPSRANKAPTKQQDWWRIFQDDTVPKTGAKLSPKHRDATIALNIGASIFNSPTKKKQHQRQVSEKSETDEERFQRLLLGGRRSFSGEARRRNQINLGGD